MNFISHIKRLCTRALGYNKKTIVSIFEIPNNKILQGRTALITGGTSGIGLSIAKAFLKAGANVIITGRNKNRSEQVARSLANFGLCKGYELDLILTNEIENQFHKIVDSLDIDIDILVNSAGIGGGDFPKCQPGEFENVIKTNLEGTFLLSQYFSRYLIKRKYRGNILMIGSSSSLRPASSAYAISKWGIRGLTKGLGKMLIKNNIVVNGIAPGPTATPMLGKLDYSNISYFKSPIKRFILPEEIANMAVILVSQLGETIIGELIYMTGGLGNIEVSDIEYNFKA